MAADFPQKVLIVDDEVHIRTYLRMIVTELGATDVKEAGDGPNALLMYKHLEPELVMLDVNLPGTSGIDLVPQILELEPNIALVMLTAVNDATTAALCMQRGALDYLTYEFEGVFVDSIQWAGGGEGIPMESVSLTFEKCTINYTVQNNDGTRSGVTPGSWNLVTNTP